MSDTKQHPVSNTARGRSIQRLLPWLVLGFSLGLSYVFWLQATHDTEQKLQTEFDFYVHESIEHIQQRIATYQQVLRGVRGLFSGSKFVDRDEFHRYISSLNIEKRYPGMLGISHVTIVPHSLLTQHVTDMRSQGFPEYTVHPTGVREIYTPVIYVEPVNERNSRIIGYDTFTEPARHATMMMAQDSSSAVLSGKVTLAQETDDKIQAGFLMILPLYNGMPRDSLADRRANISGWITAYIRADGLLYGYDNERFNDLKLELYDGKKITAHTLIYNSNGSSHHPDQLHYPLKTIKQIAVAGHTWTLVLQSTPAFEANINRDKPVFIAFAGTAISILLTLLVNALIKSKQVARKLQESEERWRYALEGAGDGVWDWNLASNEVRYSRRWKAMLGYSDNEISNNFAEWENRLHPDDRESALADVQAHVNGETPSFINEHRLLCKGGNWKWILGRGMTISHTPDGRPSRMIGTQTDITRWKFGEVELKQQRDFNNAILDVAGNIIVVLDMSGRFVRVNHAAEKLTGFSKEQLLGQPVWDWVIPEDQRPEVRSVFENLKAGKIEIATRYENDWLTQDGGRCTLDWHNTILKNDKGETTHIVALGYDITERKQNEEIIKRLYRLYSSLSHCDQAIVHSSSQEDLFPEICANVVEQGGYMMSWIGLIDVENQCVKPVASYGDGTRYLENLEISIDASDPSGNGPTGISIRENRAIWCQDFTNDPRTEHWHERGKQFGWGASASLPLHINHAPIGSLNLYAGDVNAFDEYARELLLQMAADISFALDKFAHENQRKQAEHALSESERVMRTIVSGTTTVGDNFFRALVRQLSLALGVDFAFVGELIRPDNIKIRTLSIWSGNRIVENREFDLENTPCREVLDHGMRHYQQGVTELFPEDKFLAHMGTEGYIGLPLLGAKNQTLGILVVLHDKPLPLKDYTVNILEIFAARAAAEMERMHAESELNKLNISLENRVKERTNELIQAKEQADAANQAKSDFLSNMSHEIRNPLSAIIGFSESLLTSKLSQQEQEKIISIVVRNSKHLQQIINDILDLSKIEAGQLEVDRIDTSIIHAMGEIDSLMGTSARDKGLDFKINYHFPLPKYIQTDPTCLKQILINLCSNAIKFTDKGQLVVDIDSDNDYRNIRFVVTDSGIGMTAEETDRIFDPFAQADTTTTRKYGGTGLGLSISSELARALGGSLSCISEKGKGSSFTLTITNHATDKSMVINSIDEVFAHFDGPDEQVTVNPLSGSILLVEDGYDNQQLISMYVARTGASLTITENGRQGVDKALTNQYDLILMDMQMPVMDGVEAISLLRNSGYKRPIVSLTANVMLSDRKKCFAAGADDYLAKPIDLKKFYAVLNRYLPQEQTVDNDTSDTTSISNGTNMNYHSSDRYKAIVKRFLQQLPQYVLEISEAAQIRNWEAVAAKSHDLKGMGGAVGFPEITEVAGRLNTMMKQNDHENALEILKELEDTCSNILKQNDIAAQNIAHIP